MTFRHKPASEARLRGNHLRNLAILALALAASAPQKHGERHVRGPQDFGWMMEAHAQLRVPKLARAFLADDRKRPPQEQLYSQVEDWMVEAFLGYEAAAIHDRSKWERSAEFLEYHRLLGSLPIAERLYHHLFGKFLPEMTGRKAKRAIETVRALDRVDNLERRNLLVQMNNRKPMFEASGALTEAAQQLWLLETTADVVDRAEDPTTREEFGRALKPAEEFLAGLPDNYKIFVGKKNRQIHVEAARRGSKLYWDVITYADGFPAYKLRKLREAGRKAEERGYMCFVQALRSGFR